MASKVPIVPLLIKLLGPDISGATRSHEAIDMIAAIAQVASSLSPPSALVLQVDDHKLKPQPRCRSEAHRVHCEHCLVSSFVCCLSMFLIYTLIMQQGRLDSVVY